MMKLAHYRIFGYMVTLVMHTGNTIATKLALRGKVMEDPDIQTMASMENCYFTVWNIAFQMMYATLGLYCDVKSLKSDCNQDNALTNCMKYRNNFFGIVLWPSTLFVFTIFWPIFIYDRSLVFPEFIDRAFPRYSNYIIHGAILPVVLWEMVFLPRTSPRSHKKNLIYFNTLIVVYLAWIVYVYMTRGLWPYPMMYLLEGTIYFPLFFLMVYILLHAHYYTQWILMRCIWRNIHNKKSS